MKTSNYRIVPLATDVAKAARATAARGAADHTTMITDMAVSYPCRHCLRWAKPGETVILFPFAYVPPGHSYSQTGPIFVHAEACERYDEPELFPPDFRNGRALRAYDQHCVMIDAQIVSEGEPEAMIEKLLENPETDFIHVHSTDRGCYTMAIKRV